MRCAYDLKPSMQTSSTYILYFITFGVCFLAKKRFVLSLVVLVDTTRASPFLRGIFSPTERSLFLFRVLGTKRLFFCDGSSCHRVFCENQKSSTRIERKEGSSSSFSSSFFVACADGKTNTMYLLSL